MKLLDLAKNRYSCRNYKPDQIEADKLTYILEAARIAPSAANKQPWHIVVVQDETNRQKLFDAYQREWFTKAPVYLIICGEAKTSWKRSYDGWDALLIDMGIITDHLTLAATDTGLATCWICAFNNTKLKEAIHFPEGIEPIVILPLGYPADTANPHRHDEMRKKTTEIIHWEKF